MTDEAQEELENTAEQLRLGVDDPEAAVAIDEVARGAEKGAEQPDYGIEGN